MVPFFLADCNTNFIEKLLKPQLINKLQNICEKLLNTCSFEFIFSHLHTFSKSKVYTSFLIPVQFCVNLVITIESVPTLGPSLFQMQK